MINKYLVSIEFRYSDSPKDEEYCPYKSKEITVGVYNDFDEACKEGNKTLELLESKYKLHVFPAGRKAKKERFSKNGGCFGGKKDLITNLAYLQTPFEFYAKITTLKYSNIEKIMDEVMESVKRYQTHKEVLEG